MQRGDMGGQGHGVSVGVGCELGPGTHCPLGGSQPHPHCPRTRTSGAKGARAAITDGRQLQTSRASTPTPRTQRGPITGCEEARPEDIVLKALRALREASRRCEVSTCYHHYSHCRCCGVDPTRPPAARARRRPLPTACSTGSASGLSGHDAVLLNAFLGDCNEESTSPFTQPPQVAAGQHQNEASPGSLTGDLSF